MIDQTQTNAILDEARKWKDTNERRLRIAAVVFTIVNLLWIAWDVWNQ